MSKAKVLSLSTLYATVELLEPTALKQGQFIDLSPANAPTNVTKSPQMEQNITSASVTTTKQAAQQADLSANSSLSRSQDGTT